MIAAESILIVRVLRDPPLVARLSGDEWSLLIAQGRACGLLARIGEALRHFDLESRVPLAAMRHVEAAEIVARRQYQQALFEIGNIAEALRPTACQAVLLKGAAYIALGIPAGDGRLLSDIDIMVPRSCLGAAESALMMSGWVSAEQDEYNQRYYRQWMHEIPPMRHIRRGTVVDLHHGILPLTARAKVDADKLFAEARRVPGMPCLQVLSPIDMTLHCAAHLFYEGELEKGLRDLADFDALFRHFGDAEPAYFAALVPRAVELNLMLPLYYASRYARIFFFTPLPREVEASIAAYGPARPMLALMDALFLRALSPHHPSCDDRLTSLARFLLYVRGHWLRMPPRLLLPHLARKFWMVRRAAKADPAAR